MMSFMSMFLNTANFSPGLQRFIQGIFLVGILFAPVSGGGKKKTFGPEQGRRHQAANSLT
jgi:hypothetical protein